MFKLLRKYDKWILAVGGTLLLIVFLMPQAIQGLSQWAGSRTGDLATVGPNNDAVSQLEFEGTRRQLEWLQAAGRTPNIPEPVQTPEHWYLLVREANQAGLVGDLPSLQITPRDDAERRRLGLSERDVYTALANLAGVRRVIGLYTSGNAISNNRLKARGRELVTKVYADIAVIEANPDRSSLEPTEEDLQAQLDAHAEEVPGQGEKGFGYKLPNRVKLEWLVIPEQDVRDRVAESPDFNEVELYKHWRRNSDNPSFGPVDSDIEIPEAVRNDLLNTKTENQMNAIARYAGNQLDAPARRVPRKGDFYDLPDDWSEKRVPLPELALAIQKQFDLALPTYQATGDDWTAISDVQDLDGLGRSWTDKFGANKLFITRLLGESKEFNGSGKYPVQTGMAGPPLRTNNGDLYLFRVTAADPSRAPNSIEEVPEDVAQDLRRLDNYQELTNGSDALASKAADQGILNLALTEHAEVAPNAVVTLFDPNQLEIQLQSNFPLLQPIAQPLPTIGADTETISSIVNRALELHDLGALKDQPLADRTFVLPVDDRLAVVVVQLNSIEPMDSALYSSLTQTGKLQSLMAIDELGEEEMVGVFGYDQMVERHNFELLRDSGTDEETEDASNASAGSTTDNS